MFSAPINFKKDVLVSLPIQPTQYFISDSKVAHLRVYVYPTGVKTFLLCRKIKGKWKRYKIGRVSDLTIDQARNEAVRLNSLVALGNDPQAERQEKRAEITFKELYGYYYRQHALHFTKHPEDNRKILEYHVFPKFGNTKASEITTEILRRFHLKIAETHAKSSANRIITLIASVYNFCIKNSYYTGTNPCNGVKRFKTTSRDRFLNSDELKKFFEAIKQEEELFEHFFLMLLYTGARKSNVLGMKFSDIDFELKRWRISERETKNKDVNIIPLCEQAITILSRRFIKNKSLSNPSRYVFPGDGKEGHLVDPKRAFERVRGNMGVQNFRMHDLRRTLGSYMAISGASLPVIGKALNHKSQVSTAIYARLSHDPVLDAINTAVSMIRDNKILGVFKDNIRLTEPAIGYVHFSDLLG